MGLIICPDCNREVSASASVCLGCGGPVHYRTELPGEKWGLNFAAIVGWVWAIGFFAIFFASCMAFDDNPALGVGLPFLWTVFVIWKERQIKKRSVIEAKRSSTGQPNEQKE